MERKTGTRRRRPTVSRTDYLAVFFICSCAVKTAFGLLFSSPSLLVFGLYDLYGVFFSVVARVHHGPRGSRARHRPGDSDREKLEKLILAGISILIVISTFVLFYSAVHVTFFHTLYPPDLGAAWIAIGLAAAYLGILSYPSIVKPSPRPADRERVQYLLHAGFCFSVTIACSVALSRCGFFALDYIVAILQSLCLIGYSIGYLSVSLRRLLDASCERETLALIHSAVHAAGEGVAVDELRATYAEGKLDIHAFLTLEQEAPLETAKDHVLRLRESVRSRISVPHELHVGFRMKDQE